MSSAIVLILLPLSALPVMLNNPCQHQRLLTRLMFFYWPAALLLSSPVATLASAFRTLIGISGTVWPQATEKRMVEKESRLLSQQAARCTL